MALTAYKVVIGEDLDALARNVMAAAAVGGKNVLDDAKYNVDERNWYQTMSAGTASVAGEGTTTAYDVVTGNSNDELEAKVLALGDVWLLVGGAFYNPDTRMYSQTVVQGGVSAPAAAAP